MSKKVLILSGSPRKNGNSDLLCDEFMKGAKEAGHTVEKIRVSEKDIHPCLGCYHCTDHKGQCVFKDDMAEVLQKMIDADVLVLSSPVYFYSIDAQLKAVIDRTVARWLEVKNKEFYYIVTMADENPASADTTLACFRGYADCVEGAVQKLMNPKSGKDISFHDALTISPSLVCQEGLEEAIEYCELDGKAKMRMVEDFKAIGLTVRKGYIAKDVTALLIDHIQEIIRRKKRPFARILSKIAMTLATRPTMAYGLS